MMNRRLAVWLPMIMALVLVAGIEIGLLLNSTHSQNVSFSGKGSVMDQVLDYVKNKYVDTVNFATLENKGIQSMLQDLDPHSTFIPASDLRDVNQELEGNFDGVGIEFFLVNDTIMVVSTVSGGPAESVGILSGDRIISIDDTVVAGKHISDQQVVHKLRGLKGTKVKIGVKRGVSNDLRFFTVTRDKIPLYSIDASYMIDAHTGYIKINRFSETTPDEFDKAIDTLKKQGMTSLIIDLRQNGGGILESATAVADELLDQQKEIVYTKGRVFSKTDYKTRVLGEFEDGALAILIDEGTASASEIVAGAIQDWDRGVIVGRRSFGKGLVQEQYPLSDGSALRLTIAKYYTPSGRCIQKPYDHDINAYYGEVLQRYHKGEFTNADSIHFQDTTKYYTSKGRVVHGGGGIVPDIFVPLDTSDFNNSFLTSVLNQGLIQQFAYSYYQSHPDLLKSYNDMHSFLSGFNLNDEMYNAFINYAQNENVKSDVTLQQDARPLHQRAHQGIFWAGKIRSECFLCCGEQ